MTDLAAAGDAAELAPQASIGDVLDLLRPGELVAAATDLIVCPTGFSQPLQLSGDVDVLAVEILPFDHDVAKVDPDANSRRRSAGWSALRGP